MKPLIRKTCFLLFGMMIAAVVRPEQTKEFLTSAEIDKIRDAQEINLRIKIYLEGASLRLKTAADRLAGKESAPGDPFEFFSIEDMIDGYYRILRAVMLNLDDASQKPATDPEKLQAALKNLKSVTEASVKPLEALKKVAEEKRREEMWKLVTQAIEINNGAREGAAAAIKKK